MQEKVIFVFPGQGAQYVGMGKDLFHEFAVARYTFQQVSDIAHRDITGICFNGPESELNKPENTSLGTFAHSVAIARIRPGKPPPEPRSVMVAPAGIMSASCRLS